LNAAEEIKHQQLEAFASLLEKHIRFEERELFIALEALLDEAALKEIGDALNTSTKQEDTWQDVFWLRD
jgi:hemerythrin-like domain-containing protein